MRRPSTTACTCRVPGERVSAIPRRAPRMQAFPGWSARTALLLMIMLTPLCLPSALARADDVPGRKGVPTRAPPPPAPAPKLATPPAPGTPDALPAVAPSPAPDTVGTLAVHPNWLRRMIAAIRLERADAPVAEERLRALATDADWRVRSAAILALTRRGAAPIEGFGATEPEARVWRTLLRCRWPVEIERAERGARALMKSGVPADRMLGVEIAGAMIAQKLASRQLTEFARETLSSIILRADRPTGGALSARIATITGARDVHLDFLWRSWLDKHSRTMRVDQGMLAGEGAVVPDSPLAALDEPAFARFAAALDELFRRPIDLGIAIDCTASMSGEISAAQAGIDDLTRFVNAACGGMRFALVGYRDKGDDFTTKGWDFTASPDEARARLWQLSADGGGDEPELVHMALRVAFRSFNWRPQAQRVLVLIGDAPPTPGFGADCIESARAARAAGIVTYVLSTRHPANPTEVKHFPEIARAGGGRVIRLGEQSDLVAEIAGVTLSDTWHDQMIAIYQRYLLLCR